MKSTTKSRLAVLVLSLCVFLSGGPAGAQDGDESAMQYLQAMSDGLKGAESFSFTAGVFFDEISPLGIRVKRYAVYDVVVRHPDHLAWTTSFDDGTTRKGVFDGKAVTFFSPGNKSYSRLQFQGSIDELLDNLYDNFGIGLPIADFLYSDLMEAQKPHIVSATDLGDRAVPQSTARHILVENPVADWQIWIENKQPPLPLRFVATYVRQLGDPEYMITFWKWVLNGATDDDFRFTVPTDWQEVKIAAAE